MIMAESNSDVMEGFLCPICMMNLRTPNQLIAHFQDQHEDEQDVLKSLKDLLGKARKKIGLKQDSDEGQSASSDITFQSSRQGSVVTWEKQELGTVRSHTAKLRMLRNTRLERYCAETNKLLIRLDKLLVEVPGDAAKRKAHEQSVVCWVEDTHVKLCPSCARGFHMARRKHHCRLCGAIMCHDCSQFLSVADARRMTAATSLEEPGMVRRSSSTQSLNSGQSEADIRLCDPCYQRLNQREQLKESRQARPIISQFYDKLQSHRDEATSLLAEYHKMCSSLYNGESMYHLSDAQYLRVKLIKLAEAIDSTSKAILVLGTKGGETSAPKGRALRLQQAIRSSATNFLRDHLVGLPSLPTESQLKLLQDRHRQNIETRIQSVPTSSSSPKPPQIVANAGWGPNNASKLIECDDIVVQQMNNLKSFIKQARDAHKYDEVSMLEANLRELQEEYWRQNQHQ